MKRFILTAENRAEVIPRIGEFIRALDCEKPKVVKFTEQTRTTEQNAKMWPMLHDLEKQADIQGIKLNKAEWKDFATATLEAQKIVPNLDGTGFIAVGGRTSDMNKKKFCDLIEIIYMIGARCNVHWSERAQDMFDEYREKHEAD